MTNKLRIWPIINDIAIATGKPNEATHLLTMVEKVFAKHEPMPGRKNRAFLQEIGTECVRKQFDDLAWVKYLIYKYGNDDTIARVMYDLKMKQRPIVMQVLCLLD